MARRFTMYAAAHTPMKGDLSINYSVIPRQVEYLSKLGAHGAFVNGTTGEGMTMSLDERMQVASRWMSAVKKCRPRLDVLVHAAHPCMADARKLAAHAQKIGADGIVAVFPLQSPGISAEGVADYCANIAAAAPKTPFYYYHIPGMTNIKPTACSIVHALAHKVPTFAGLKFTHEDLMDLGLCHDFSQGRYTLMIGRDEMLLPALSIGINGGLGHTYNFAGRLYLALARAWFAGDVAKAQKFQAQSRELCEVVLRHNIMRSGKATMELLGIPVGPPRPPVKDFTPAERERFRSEMEAIGFFNYGGLRG